METKKAAIYIRVSTLDQARDGYSLDAQEKALRKWCADKNYAIYDLYADRGISGRHADNRPEFTRLLKDAQNQKFDIIVFWALSRFTRSVADLYITVEKLRNWNIGIASYTESIDTTTPAGRATLGVLGVFAQLESELIGERVALSMAERAQQGKRTANEVLGYDKVGKDTWKINPTEAIYVKFCFESYLKYRSLSIVAREARRKGYCGKRGAIPSAYHIQVILCNPIYCGFNRFGKCIFKGNHEPLVSIDTFNKVQTILLRQGKLYGHTRKHAIKQIKL